jgi:hypothetical protein
MPARLVSVLIAVIGAWAMIRFGALSWCARDAEAWRRGDAERQLALARGLAVDLERDLDPSRFATGSARFDGEWLFGTYVMAALGFSQIALEHPEHAAELRPWVARAIDGALSARARAFDHAAWGQDPLATLESDQAHAAYLGYLGVALGLERRLTRMNPHAELHDRLAAALERRLSRALLLETYPGEIYPVDNASAIATLALHADALGKPRPEVIGAWLSACRDRFVDHDTGLLVQAMAGDGRTRRDGPRGSGTALAAYFLAYADPELSAELHRALERELAGHVLGFGVVSEYPAAMPGRGDIDSGPLVFGYSISAMGFSLAGCRIHDDARCFRDRYASFHLLGAPLTRGDHSTFVSGGPLGNAIVLAMLTAPRAQR